MADILQTILQFLNVNCQYINCYYPNPFEGLFYLVLLPAAVLLAFLYIIFNNVLKLQHVGIKLLLTIVIFIFIIIEGWFTLFISIGPIWVFAVLILAVFIAIFGRWRRGRGPTGGGGAMPGIVRYGFQKAKKGGRKIGIEQEIDSAIKTLETTASELMNPRPGTDMGLLTREYRGALKDALDVTNKLKHQIGGESGDAITKPYFDRISAIQNEVKRRV